MNKKDPFRSLKKLNISKEEFINISNNSISKEEISRKLNLSSNTITRLQKQLNCKTILNRSITHTNKDKLVFDIDKWNNDNIINLSRCTLRKHIISKNLIEYKCNICKLNEWEGKPLILDLDHIDGKYKNHRKTNLRFLCPNCHSQTDNYRALNKRID